MKPYKFEPYLKTTIWGGYQIAPFKGIYTAQPNIGESWEISGVPGHESVAINRGLVDDVDEGLTLTQLIDKYKGLLVGQKVYKKFGNKFPCSSSSSTRAKTSACRCILTTSWPWSVTAVPVRRRCGTSSRVMWARRSMRV